MGSDRALLTFNLGAARSDFVSMSDAGKREGRWLIARDVRGAYASASRREEEGKGNERMNICKRKCIENVMRRQMKYL